MKKYNEYFATLGFRHMMPAWATLLMAGVGLSIKTHSLLPAAITSASLMADSIQAIARTALLSKKNRTTAYSAIECLVALALCAKDKALAARNKALEDAAAELLKEKTDERLLAEKREAEEFDAWAIISMTKHNEK
ncbi:MAG: hypothetical protein LBH81_02810 [Rickettsiales bacterium]|jgi:hypothetical protein|nr:hypothetical protein [Rickettsiales bacterium]